MSEDGYNNGRSAFSPLFMQFDPDGTKALQHAEGTGTARAENRIEAERRSADAEAMRYLAEMDCPADLIKWGQNHNIPTFAEFTWQAGFIQGWRMAMRARKDGA